MGLYDWIYIEIECPNCKEQVKVEMQTYDLGRNFYEFNLGDEIDLPTPLRLVGSCKECLCFFDAWGNIKDKRLESVEIFKYSISLNETIKIKHDDR